MLEFFSGSSSAVNSKSAVRECLDLAFGEGGGSDANIVFVHSTMGHNMAQIHDAIQAFCPDAEIVGCTGSGVIGREGVSENMRALALMAVVGDECAVIQNAGLTSTNSRDLAAETAQALKAKLDGINMIYVITAGLDVAGDRVIAGIESVFGPDTPLFGASAGDNGKAARTFQFHSGGVLEDGITMVGFADPTLELLTGVHHGSLPVEGMTFDVTKSDGNQIIELDGKPAWPTLMGRLGLPPETDPGSVLGMSGLGEDLSPEDADEYDNKQILRVPIRVTDDHQTFFVHSTCEEGTKLTLMQRDEQHIFDGVDRLMSRMTDALVGRKPVAVFQSDCMARGRMTFNKILKDEIIAKIQYPLAGDDGVPWLGVYGYAEFSRLSGRNRFHNYTTSLYPLVRRESA
ncbi:MAG: FIST N-terminal domain-containing protein [Alphaproteobacteria bacterium]